MSPTTAGNAIVILGLVVFCFVVNAVLNIIEEWSERRKPPASAEADAHLKAIKSMERIQTAYFEAQAALRDQQGGHHGQ